MTIQRPVEKVVEFVDDPGRLAQCAPMVERAVKSDIDELLERMKRQLERETILAQ